MKKKMWAIATIFALALGASGCTASDDGSSKKGGSNDATLVVGTMSDLASATPGAGVDGGDYQYLFPLYDRLVNFDPKTMEMLPSAGLAKSWKFANKDLTKFHITLKDGVTFHDGTPLDAQAVKASLEAVKKFGLLTDLDPVTNISVDGDLDLTLTTDRPYSVLPAVLSDRSGMIMSPTALKEHGEKAGKFGAGTGPYVLKEWNHGENVILKRNDDYYGKPAAFKTIEFKYFSEQASLVSAIQTNQVDFATYIDPANRPAVTSAAGFKTVDEPTYQARLVQVNNSVAPLDNVTVRQALDMAINRKDTIVAKFGPDSGAVATTIPIRKGSPAFTPGLDVKYDPDKAKSLLKEAGLSKVDIALCGLPGDTQEIELARVDAAKAGFVFNVDIQPNVATCIDGIGNGTYGLFWIGWSGRPAPYMTYSQLAGPNYQPGDYHFPDIFALLDEALATTDKDKISDIYEKVNKLWVSQVPQIVTYFQPKISVYSDDITGSASTLMGRIDVTALAPAK